MPMQFDEFIRQIDGAVRSLGPVERFDGGGERQATWSAGQRRADVALVPPLNVSVSLAGPGEPAVTTWYPVDAALVALVSRRIAGYLSES